MHSQSVRKQQLGITLSGLLMICFAIGILALLAMKIGPEYMEFGTIRKITQAIAQDPAMRSASLGDVKMSFNKRASIDNISAISAEDLDISKEDDKLVIAYTYTKKVPLFANISLLIDFEGSTNKQ